MSWIKLIDDNIIEFDLNNTPIENFCDSSTFQMSTIEINGQNIAKGNIKEINFRNSYNIITELPDYFMSEWNNLIKISFSGLKNITEIGTNFLSNAGVLLDLDLSMFNNVNKIGNDFLLNLKGISQIDLSTFKNITEIPYNFLQGSSLKSVDLSPFTLVEKINSGLLQESILLESADLSGFESLQLVNDYFFNNCSSLLLIKIGKIDWNEITLFKSSLFLKGVPNVKFGYVIAETNKLGKYFKDKMNNISWWKVQSILYELFRSEMNLSRNFIKVRYGSINDPITWETISLPMEFSSIEDLCWDGNLPAVYNLGGKDIPAEYIRRVHFSDWDKDLDFIDHIPEKFLNHCINLHDIDLTALKYVRNIEKDFMKDCDNLKVVRTGFINAEWFNSENYLTAIILSDDPGFNQFGPRTPDYKLLPIIDAPKIKVSSINNEITFKFEDNLFTSYTLHYGEYNTGTIIWKTPINITDNEYVFVMEEKEYIMNVVGNIGIFSSLATEDRLFKP